MKRILYLSFYFEPDLCAGSFRNTPLAREMAKQLKDGVIDVITTLPNRYSTFDISAPAKEDHGNLTIYRVLVPGHRSGFADQINTFRAYFSGVKKIARGKKYDLVFASSSRLFTAYLGYLMAKKNNASLYLDIRDIFIDTMENVLKNPLVKAAVLPVLKTIENRVFNYASHINLISKGFLPYFKKYPKTEYSFFSNGIDPEFLHVKPSVANEKGPMLITYAGNIGEGQGLHKIIPQSAKQLGKDYRFVIIGDGGAKLKLQKAIDQFQVNNVEIKNPMSRDELLNYYERSDFLLIHLNDFDAFKRVLPSKIFELGAYDKPIIAGVAGYARDFISENIPNSILFPPGDVDSLVEKMKGYKYTTTYRKEFIDKFQRTNIDRAMTQNVLSYLK